MLSTTQCVDCLKETFPYTEKEYPISGLTLNKVWNVVASNTGKPVNVYNVINALDILGYEILIIPQNQKEKLQNIAINSRKQ